MKAQCAISERRMAKDAKCELEGGSKRRGRHGKVKRTEETCPNLVNILPPSRDSLEKYMDLEKRQHNSSWY
jgi:hypothetical protein